LLSGISGGKPLDCPVVWIMGFDPHLSHQGN
jgi:hypothetical protein